MLYLELDGLWSLSCVRLQSGSFSISAAKTWLETVLSESKLMVLHARWIVFLHCSEFVVREA